MSSNKSNGKKPADDSGTRVIARNRRARHDYDIVDELDCGIMLIGSEVKSIRDNKITIDEAFARVEGGEVFLYNVDIAEFPQASYLNHERKRTRKLLMRKREIAKFAETAQQQGMTLVPLEVFFSRGIVKVKLAVAKGRKVHDKRDRIKAGARARILLIRAYDDKPLDEARDLLKRLRADGIANTRATLKAEKRRFLAIRGELPSHLDPPTGCHFHPRCPFAFGRCREEVPQLREIAPRHRVACHLHDGG